MSDPNTTQLKVRYDTSSALYTNQIVVNANREDLTLDFSSGAVPDPETGNPVLPIHSRIALSWAGALRLRALIDQAVERQEKLIAAEAASQTQEEQAGTTPAK